MISIDKALLRQLLMIERPWEVREYHLDLRKRRIDIWIGEEVERGWFGREKKPARPSTEHHWQHVSFGPLKLQLHVSVPHGMDTRNLAWTGDIGMPFTRALANRVFTLFNEGLSLAVVCKLLELTLQDVWRYRYALDNGRTTVSAAEAEAAAPKEMQAEPVAAKPQAAGAAAAGNAATDVPDVTNPVWQRLLEGDVSLDIKVLSLKLMLTRTRSQMELITDDEVRMLKMRDLHRYFVKNQRVLGHELSQIRSAA
ncbi:hypothetical protein [Hydrogenophaga sp. 5NK40-0174]|uniref:hypothetical protein n=1 Tax=Hydrogenophaga sp. 5NK40-0174 TaxID=3127649 RepID=UPI003108AD0A